MRLSGSKLGPLNSQNLLLGCASVVATSNAAIVVFFVSPCRVYLKLGHSEKGTKI